MSQRPTNPWDRFVEEWNAEFWNLGLDIVSTVIFRDEDSDRVAGVYYLTDKSIFVSCYDEDDLLIQDIDTDFFRWPLTAQYADEDEALTAATDWIDDCKVPSFTHSYAWYSDFVGGRFWDKEEEE
jgi:hypothetical protein